MHSLAWRFSPNSAPSSAKAACRPTIAFLKSDRSNDPTADERNDDQGIAMVRPRHTIAEIFVRGCRVITVSSGVFWTIPGWLSHLLVVIVISRS